MKFSKPIVGVFCLLLATGCLFDKKLQNSAEKIGQNSATNILGKDPLTQGRGVDTPETTHNQSANVMTASHNSDASEPIKKKQGLAESFLFQPLKYPKGFDRLIIEGQRVQFKSEDDTELDGRYFRGVNPQGVIVFCHGNGGNLASRTSRMHELQKTLNYSVFIFDYRGYGRSAGKPTVSGIVADGRAALRKAAELAKINPEDVIVMGRSMGGAVAVQLANHFQSKALIVESSFTSFKDVAKHHVGMLSVAANKKHLTSENDIKNFRGRVLISHGTADKVVPFQHGKRLYAAANQPKLFYEVTNGGHNDPMPEAYNEILKKFLGAL